MTVTRGTPLVAEL